MDYLQRLNNYDGPDIAKIAASPRYELFEEAFFIYKKEKMGPAAMEILIEKIGDLNRAVEFANYWNSPDVWSLLGGAQLRGGYTKEAIASYLRAGDASAYLEIIEAANEHELFEDLIPFLRMARSKVKDSTIDNELLYAHARTENLAALEEFLNSPNTCKVEEIGDRVFSEGLFHAARILYEFVKNYSKLALCYVHLEMFQQAVDAARKANNIPTWKAVCYACVDAEEFRLAQACGVNVIVFMDHLNDLIHHYEQGGYFEQVIALMEQGLNLERAHQGIFTTLGILYCKYKEDKLMEHIRLFVSRLNVSVLLGACRQNQHWKEVVYLLQHYDQFENAVDTMIEHSPTCWEHEHFKQLLRQVPNSECYYRAFTFYLQENPLMANDLLIDISAKLDHGRIVQIAKRSDNIPLIAKYLQHVQRANIGAVNEALNNLYVQDENYRALRESVDTFDQFDQIDLAQKLERHHLLEFRRIASHLYKINRRWDIAIELSKKDNVYADVIQVAAESCDSKICDGVMRYFVDKEEHACFTATLYACYKYVPHDAALELAWRFNLYDMVMPFMIQVFRHYDERIKTLEDRFNSQDVENQKAEEEEKKKQEVENSKAAAFVGVPSLGAPMLALPPSSGMGMPMMGGPGMGMGMSGMPGMAPPMMGMGMPGMGGPPMGPSNMGNRGPPGGFPPMF